MNNYLFICAHTFKFIRKETSFNCSACIVEPNAAYACSVSSC